MKNLPEQIAEKLYRLILRVSPATKNRHRISLELLHAGGDPGKLHEAFYVRKLKLCVYVAMAGIALASLMHVQAIQKRVISKDDLVREEFGGKDLELNLTAEGEKDSAEVTMLLRRRILTEEETEEYFAEFEAELPERILGENPDTGHVSEDLVLTDEYEGYPFEVEWRSSEPEIVRGFSGKVTEVSERTEVLLTAKCTYGDYERLLEIPVTVVRPEESSAQYLERTLLTELTGKETESRQESDYVLPEEVDGQAIHWSKTVKDRSGHVLAGSFLVAILIYFLSDRDLEQELEKRRERMRAEYPDLVWMLTLYMGAGLGARGAFRRIGEEYEMRKARGEPEEPIYEEVLRVCHELGMGRGEGECMESLGKRTGLQEYIRLCTLLSQNLSKGDSKLLTRLREETAAASRMRVQNCRRAADEASTKLLLPMVLLLLVVMVMIMTPAFAAQNL